MLLRSILKCKFKLKSVLVIIMTCMVFHVKKTYADVGKSGWPIFRKAQAANTRGILSTFGQYSSLSGLFYNPALAAGKDRREAYFFSESGMVGDTMGGLMYVEPLKNGAIAGSIVGYDAGSIELNWIENGALKTQNASAEKDLMGSVMYGRRLRDNLYAGVSIKAATTQLAERNSANAFGMDLGATYTTPKGFMFSGALQNVGTSTKFIEKANPLPTSAYFGAGYGTKVKKSFLLAGAGANYNMVDQKMIPEVGAELRYQMFSINLGYRFADEQTLTMGLGLHVNNIEINYAYVPGIYLGATHRMSVSYKFRTPLEKKQALAPQPVGGSSAMQPVARIAPKVKPVAAAAAAPVTAKTVAPASAPAAKTPVPQSKSISLTPKALKTGLQEQAAKKAVSGNVAKAKKKAVDSEKKQPVSQAKDAAKSTPDAS